VKICRLEARCRKHRLIGAKPDVPSSQSTTVANCDPIFSAGADLLWDVLIETKTLQI